MTRHSMKMFHFKKIDAFTDGRSAGNPAAAVYLDSFRDISDDEMQQIAREMKGFVNEVGYVVRTGSRSFQLRYFSSEREVAFCGHATIAIMYDLIKNDDELRDEPLLTISIGRGELEVLNRVAVGEGVFISAPLPRYLDCGVSRSMTADAMGFGAEILSNLPLEIIDAGLRTLIVPMINLGAVLNVNPDERELRQFCQENDLDIITIFSEETASLDHRFRSRVFAPTFGYLEDPATGSGNAALGYYLLKHKKWDGRSMSIEQNNLRDRNNTVRLAGLGKEDKQSVAFGGQAITRISGAYHVYSAG